MTHRFLLKAGAAFAAALAFAAPAFAAGPLSLGTTTSPVILVGDEENEEVWHDLRPDVTPPPGIVGKEGEAPAGTMHEPPKEEGSGDVEDKELWRDLETGVTPPPEDE